MVEEKNKKSRQGCIILLQEETASIQNKKYNLPPLGWQVFNPYLNELKRTIMKQAYIL